MSVFSSVLYRRPRKSKFNLSFENKLSMNLGDLVPVFCKETLPGDRFKVNTEQVLRFAPMLAPVMHRVKVYMHYFFVPNRILWNKWEDFITGGRLGTETPAVPYFLHSDLLGSHLETRQHFFLNGSLTDYLGVPTLSEDDYSNNRISLLPFLAYQQVYNDYYRDQNLTAEVEWDKDMEGEVTNEELLAEVLKLRRRCWEKDYFTSSLPFAQRGEDVTIPLDFGNDGKMQVKYQNTAFTQGEGTVFRNPADGTAITTAGLVVTGGTDGRARKTDAANNNKIGEITIGQQGITQPVNNNTMSFGTTKNLDIDNSDNLYIDVEENNANLLLNDIRVSERIQEWLERNARGGARYIEQILSHFGVVGDDARLQRAEYLGGGSQPVIFSEVTQTSSGTESSALGDFAGHGVSLGNTMSFNRKFKEHGFVIGIMSIMPRTSYQQGLSRMFTRFDKFDYYFPEFAELGEQEVKERELYCVRSIADGVHEAQTLEELNDETFGYQQRYAEYKYNPSEVHGDFRSSLNYWHMGRIFGNREGSENEGVPRLNQDFVESHPTNRIFNVVSENYNKVYVNLYHNFTAIRPMPRHAVPTI